MSKLSELIGDSMSKIREFVDVNTVIGDPITTPDGTTLIPISKVAFGFVSGGTDADAGKKQDKAIRFGAGSGAGVSITPVGFMVIKEGVTRVIYVTPGTNTTLDKIVDLVPEVIEKFKKKETEAEY